VIGSIWLAGTDVDGFKRRIAKDLCSGITLAPMQTCTVGLKFKPHNSGPHSANLVIPSSDFNENTASVHLSGTGL
jgi:hypothetical protein